MDMGSSSVVSNVLLLASSWLNISLYTLELVLCRRYFQRPNRPLLYQIAVGALIFFDTVCTFTICVNVCFVVLSIPVGGNPVALLSPTSIVIFMTYCSAAIEQTILCHLFFSLTGKMLISAGLALLILVHMGIAFASGGLILALNSELTAALTTATAASVTCAATDISIAICLSVKLWKMLSPADVIAPTDSLVRKFCLLVVGSGLTVASNTLIMMLLKHSPALDFFFSCQGRVYSLTLLANFLLGVHLRRDTNTDTRRDAHGALSQRNPHSIVTGLEFDRVDGYDTESTSQNARREHGEESKSPTASRHPPVAPNYNVGVQMTRLDHRLPLHVKSEP
ncbi:hypothetical protein DFH09DRAFT_1368521 [Mycena vulgaris]|nr:hypothetical protein DFH09DRAFT_1368521 [Mycena vulgaris]